MDMDGTLLDSSSHIPPATKQALITLQEQGVQIVLASGRSYFRLRPIVEELRMNDYGGFIIEINGMAYCDIKKDQRNVLMRMDPDDANELFDFCKALDGEVMAFYDDGLFDYHSERLRTIKKQLRKEMGYPDDFPWTGGPWSWLMDTRDGYPHIDYITSHEEITCVVNKVQIIEDEERMKEIYPILYDKYHDRFEIYRTCARLIEIMPKGASKGNGLRFLMNQQGWKPDEVLVFGDGENDVSMFDEVTTSFAMGQAEDFVKERASDTTLTNDQEGVLYRLKEYFPELKQR